MSSSSSSSLSEASSSNLPPPPPPAQYPALFGDASVDHAVAGFGAGTIATLVMHPLDLVKVRFQLASIPTSSRLIRQAQQSQLAAQTSTASAASSSLGSGSVASSSSLVNSLKQSQAQVNVIPTERARLGTGVYRALRDAVRADGWQGLYRGLIPNLVGGSMSWGLYFLFYNMIKKQMQHGDPTYQTSSSQHLLAAAEASAITAMLTNPIWVVKTRVFASSSSDPTSYRGLWDGIKTIARTEGWRGLYKGSLLALVGVSNGSIQFAAYEEIKLRRKRIKMARIERAGGSWKREDEKLSNVEYILASGSSKMVAIALTYPYQVVRARIQNKSTTHLYPNIPTTIKNIFKQEGILAFYKGLGTNGLRILPGTCLTFVTYENLVWGFRTLASRREEKAGRGLPE